MIFLYRTDTGTVIDLSEANGVSSQELSPLLDASEQILKQIWSTIVSPSENELTGNILFIGVENACQISYKPQLQNCGLEASWNWSK